jgi:hypothetical protein
MNKLHSDHIILAFVTLLTILAILFGPKDHLYDYLKKKRLEYHHQQQFEKYKIVCHQCKGSGEYPTDVNKLMVKASITLFINKHLMVDKCKECVKLEKGDGYVYCKVVNDRYRTLLEEYIAAGRKIEMATCSECMGMGTFTSQNSDGSYVTQEEYDSKHHK